MQKRGASTSQTLATAGVRLRLLKSPSVGSAGKRSTGPFSISASPPSRALFFCYKSGSCLHNNYESFFVQRTNFFEQREVQAPLKPLQLQGFVSLSRPPKVGLGRFSGEKVHWTFSYIRFNLKSPSVGSAGKRSTGPFSISTSPPSRTLFFCPNFAKNKVCVKQTL